jgi:eukaryotic-like serine/threonine-protein kinase
MTCPHCGTDTPAGAARCVGCGASHAPTSLSAALPGAAAPTAFVGGGAPNSERDTRTIANGAARLDVDATQPLVPPSFQIPSETRRSAGGSRQFTMLTPGETLGARYHIIRLLGVGGMGAVYHAWDAELGVAVALKVIRGDITGDTEQAAAIERQFKRELLMARQVTHKHVVRIHDLGDVDGLKYISMPYVQGADLATVLQQSGTLPVPRALGYVRQIVDGLVAAHEAGVIHRDLKPANIMIDDDDQALIMDFGIARSPTNTGSGMSKVVGTLAYMAPEQAQAQATDQRADVYALGMMFREMLIGRARGDDEQAAPPRVRTVDQSIPEPIDTMIARCLEPDPAHRFQTSAELAAALAALDADGQPKPIPARVLSPWRMTAAAVLIVAAIGAAAVVVRRSRPPAAPKPITPVSILVADFENKTGDAVFDNALEQPLTIAMEGASFINTYARRDALKLAQTLSGATRLDAAAARPVAFREGIKYVLAGTVTSNDGAFALTVDALEPATGKTVKSATATAASKADVLGAVGKLAATIRTGLGDTASDSAKLAAAETFTAGSIDAMREYSIAQDLQQNENEEALAHYRKAIELDPKFGRAYAGAANINFRLGRQLDAEAQFKQALALMDRMTDREKHRTLGSYYVQVAGNCEKGVEEYSALVKAYPADTAGHSNLAVAYFCLLDFKRAVDEGQRAVEAYPKNTTARYNLALFKMYAGDFEGASSSARSAIAESPAIFKARLPLAMAAIANGDLAAANAAYLDMVGTGAAGASLAAIGFADLGLYAGRIDGVAANLKSSIDDDLSTKTTTPAAVKQIALAETELAAGRRAQAIDAAREALTLSRQLATVVPAARVFVRAGRIADARALAAELGSQLPKPNRAYAKIILAEIALEDRKPADAVDLLTQARSLADLWLGRFDLGVAYVHANAFAEAITEFEACQKRRGEATALFLDDRPTIRYFAPIPYWLGRAQEGLGQASSARASYDAFLAVRKDAETDPLVQDARRRVR